MSFKLPVHPSVPPAKRHLSPRIFVPQTFRLSQGSSVSELGTSAIADTLDMLLSHCQSSQDAKAFLYDELALSGASGALGAEATAALVNMLFGGCEAVGHVFFHDPSSFFYTKPSIFIVT